MPAPDRRAAMRARMSCRSGTTWLAAGLICSQTALDAVKPQDEWHEMAPSARRKWIGSRTGGVGGSVRPRAS